MNHRTNYPAGSPKDILVRLRRIEKEIRQEIRDIQSVNDNNPNFKDEPMDIGRYLVRLKLTRRVIAAVKAEIDGGAEKLSRDILKPLCEPW